LEAYFIFTLKLIRRVWQAIVFLLLIVAVPGSNIFYSKQLKEKQAETAN
jgi:hypothetical protein